MKNFRNVKQWLSDHVIGVAALVLLGGLLMSVTVFEIIRGDDAVIFTDVAGTSTSEVTHYTDAVIIKPGGDMSLHVEVTGGDSVTTVYLQGTNFGRNDGFWQNLDTTTVSGVAGTLKGITSIVWPGMIRAAVVTKDTCNVNIGLKFDAQ